MMPEYPPEWLVDVLLYVAGLLTYQLCRFTILALRRWDENDPYKPGGHNG